MNVFMGKQCVYTVHRNVYSSTPPKSSDLAEYEELRQLKDIKSKSFYEEEGTRAEITFITSTCKAGFFLEDTVPKNIATSLKSDKFLNFFFRQLKDNNTNKFGEYPYFSPCGNESNFVKCADTPIVFSDLVKDEKRGGIHVLTWGHSLSIPFQADKLRISLETGRLYHPFHTKNAKKFINRAGGMYGLLKSHLTISISDRIVVSNRQRKW